VHLLVQLNNNVATVLDLISYRETLRFIRDIRCS